VDIKLDEDDIMALPSTSERTARLKPQPPLQSTPHTKTTKTLVVKPPTLAWEPQRRGRRTPVVDSHFGGMTPLHASRLDIIGDDKDGQQKYMSGLLADVARLDKRDVDGKSRRLQIRIFNIFRLMLTKTRRVLAISRSQYPPS
jgi:hypothetical protein